MDEFKTPRLLRADEIEIRVSRYIENNGASVLLYKTARVDMDILDETYGTGAWTNDYKEIKGVLFCGIAVNGVWKWDCGVESNTEAEKGEASDAFKRAGFRWGIGRELYSAPFIWIPESKFETKIDKGKKVIKDKFVIWDIRYNENRKISYLKIRNANTGAEVFWYSRPDTPATPHQGAEKPIKPVLTPKPEQIPTEESKPATEHICADCGKGITEPNIAEGTLKAYGRMLCRECGMKEKHRAAEVKKA